MASDRSSFLQLTASEDGAEGESSSEVNPDARYWGEPNIGADGTEGNGAYYSGNYLPESPELPREHEKYWRKSPYWNYFKSVWGDAPMADANFELWIRGFFKDFSLPRHPQEGQTTKGLPAWLHYYSSKYDPLEDPPYLSDYSLFSTEEGAEAIEKKRPDEASNYKEVNTGEAAVFSDCSEISGTQSIDRPCAVRTAQRYHVRPLAEGPGGGALDTRTVWTDRRNIAGPIAGTPGDESLKDTYIKIDNFWGNAKIEADPAQRPANVPPPPNDPPELEVEGVEFEETGDSGE